MKDMPCNRRYRFHAYDFLPGPKEHMVGRTGADERVEAEGSVGGSRLSPVPVRVDGLMAGAVVACVDSRKDSFKSSKI